MKKYFRQEKPKKDQIIGFKTTNAFYPEIGVFQTFDNGIEEVYVPANDDVEQLINIDYWFEIPQLKEAHQPLLQQHDVMPSLLEGKYILDCCCGSRMFWFDKNNPAVLFADIREVETELCDGRMLEVKPDIIADFRKMPFEDNTFKMVVFDPPHLNKLGQDTWMAQKYGVLLPSWEHDIKEGFEEAMRVLQPFGTLIFKWNEVQITTNKILQIIGVEPLFGHPSGKHGRTKWMAFMKGVSQ